MLTVRWKKPRMAFCARGCLCLMLRVDAIYQCNPLANPPSYWHGPTVTQTFIPWPIRALAGGLLAPWNQRVTIGEAHQALALQRCQSAHGPLCCHRRRVQRAQRWTHVLGAGVLGARQTLRKRNARRVRAGGQRVAGVARARRAVVRRRRDLRGVERNRNQVVVLVPRRPCRALGPLCTHRLAHDGGNKRAYIGAGWPVATSSVPARPQGWTDQNYSAVAVEVEVRSKATACSAA